MNFINLGRLLQGAGGELETKASFVVAGNITHTYTYLGTALSFHVHVHVCVHVHVRMHAEYNCNINYMICFKTSRTTTFVKFVKYMSLIKTRVHVHAQ